MQNKPISVGIRETKTQIVDVLNNSGLPLEVMSYILKDILSVVEMQADAEYQQAIRNMEESETE